jgi:hypothetical protein
MEEEGPRRRREDRKVLRPTRYTVASSVEWIAPTVRQLGGETEVKRINC